MPLAVKDTTAARAQTMLRDFNRLRKAIRAFDPEAADKALDRCERWFDLIDPNNLQKMHSTNDRGE